MNYSFLDEYLRSMKGATMDFKEEWQWTRYLIRNTLILWVHL